MRSIELGWLQRIDKALPLPRLVFAPIGTGGCYYTPHESEETIEGIFVPRDAGIIVCSTLFEHCAATLAHEWRHHFQFYHGWEFDSPGWNFTDDYDAELRAYFAGSVIERDALRFEMKTAPAEHHDEWSRILEGVIRR